MLRQSPRSELDADSYRWFAAAGENAATTNKRDIVDNKTSTTAERWIAIYKHFPFPFIRVRHALSGGTPSITYSATGMVK